MKHHHHFQPGDRVSLRVTDLTRTGEGVGHVNGMTVFADGAVPGDEGIIEIFQVKQQYLKGKIVKNTKTSDARCVPSCTAAGKCGGCPWSFINYKTQLSLKTDIVKNSLTRIGHFEDIGSKMLPIIPSDSEFGYRNKAQYKVSKQGIGFYAKGTHTVIPIPGCALQRDGGEIVIDAVSAWIKASHISIYDEKSGRGSLRGILVRNNSVGEISLTVILADDRGIDFQLLIDTLRKNVPKLAGIAVNINASRGNRVLGKRTKTIWGSEKITETLCGLQFEISPASFFQVNTAQAEKLYDAAGKFADLDGSQTIFDLYCGTGTIGLSLAEKAQRVYGIEIVSDAVEDAKRNAEINGIANAKFFCGKAEETAPELMKAVGKPDVIILDPPRKGCAASLINKLVEWQIPKIVYVSCDPTTLARDAEMLSNGGYQPEKVQPVDMFPQTGHVETVCLLSKSKKIEGS